MHLRNDTLENVRKKHKWGKELQFTIESAPIDFDEEPDFTINDLIATKNVIYL